jgi:hypothetical protein
MQAILWRHHKYKIIAASIATAFFALLIFSINQLFYNIGFWDHFLFKQGIEVWFCEKTDLKNLIRQPVNTFTNITYLVNAVFFTVKGIQDYRRREPYNLITANSFYSFTLGAVSLYTFIGSTFFHASLIMFASKIDFSAVYSVSLYPLMYFTHRIWLLLTKRDSKVKHLKGMLLLIAVFTLIYITLTSFVSLKYVHEFVLFFIILTAIFGVVLEKADRAKSNKLYLWLTIIFISIAIIFFKLDIEKILCNPDSFFQPHSIWHICNGCAVFYFYLYIRSEHYNSAHDKEVNALKQHFLEDKKQ